MLKINLSFFLCAAFLAASLSAQTTGAGTITGTITDPSGAVVPAAAVAVKNTATQAERALTTNEAGIYVAQFLQPGAYEITITKPGFNKTRAHRADAASGTVPDGELQPSRCRVPRKP